MCNIYTLIILKKEIMSKVFSKKWVYGIKKPLVYFKDFYLTNFA
jgi:hypothetical protein